jgi:hypothetical protein
MGLLNTRAGAKLIYAEGFLVNIRKPSLNNNYLFNCTT